MSQLRTVRLYGRLGARFGRVHRFHLDTSTVAEAVRALDSQIKGFRAYLASSKDRDEEFAVFAGKRNLCEDELRNPCGSEDIRIAPVIGGRKNGGILQSVVGIVLIALSFVPGFQAAAPYLMSTGIAMLAGGVIQLLSPQLKGGGGKESSNQPSYVFNGAVNTEAQGHPVPLLYGRMIVGSAVVSAGIEAADYAPATAGVGTGTPGGSYKTNFYQA